MNPRLITSIVVKDLTLYFRNRFFAFVTILGLVFYIIIYLLLPQQVDETLEIGFVGPDFPAPLVDEMGDDGVALIARDSESALRESIAEGDFAVGVVLADDFITSLGRGDKGRARILFSSDFPEELKEIYVVLFEELAFLLAGQPLRLEVTEEVLGRDLAGQQIPTRDRLIPLMAVFLLWLEVLGLATLITAEVESGTIQAVLITPLRVEGLFAAKAIFGVSLAFIQAILLLAITVGLSHNGLLLATALLLGSLFVTGVAFLIASVARDMMSVMGWGILAMLLLALPAFGILVPGLTSDWVKVIPSFFLIDTVFQAANFDYSWADASGNLTLLLASGLVLFALGVLTLRRKFQ